MVEMIMAAFGRPDDAVAARRDLAAIGYGLDELTAMWSSGTLLAESDRPDRGIMVSGIIVASPLVASGELSMATAGFTSALRQVGVPEDVARIYETAIRKGGMVIGAPVRADMSAGEEFVAHGGRELANIQVGEAPTEPRGRPGTKAQPILPAFGERPESGDEA